MFTYKPKLASVAICLAFPALVGLIITFSPEGAGIRDALAGLVTSLLALIAPIAKPVLCALWSAFAFVLPLLTAITAGIAAHRLHAHDSDNNDLEDSFGRAVVSGFLVFVFLLLLPYTTYWSIAFMVLSVILIWASSKEGDNAQENSERVGVAMLFAVVIIIVGLVVRGSEDVQKRNEDFAAIKYAPQMTTHQITEADAAYARYIEKNAGPRFERFIAEIEDTPFKPTSSTAAAMRIDDEIVLCTVTENKVSTGKGFKQIFRPAFERACLEALGKI